MIYMFFYYEKLKEKLKDVAGEFGVGTLLSIAVSIIVCAFVFIPGMRTFSDSMLTSMKTWWATVSGTVFPTT